MVGPRGAGDAESSGSSKSKARSTPVQLLDIGIVVAGSFLGLELWVLAHKTLFWIQCARKGELRRLQKVKGQELELGYMAPASELAARCLPLANFQEENLMSSAYIQETTKEEVNKGVQEDAVPNKAAGERMQQQPEQLSPQPQPTAHRAHPLPTAPAPAAQVQEQPGQLSPQPQPIAHSPHPQPTATVAEVQQQAQPPVVETTPNKGAEEGVQQQQQQQQPQQAEVKMTPRELTQKESKAAKWQAAQEKAAAEKEAKAVAARQLKERLAAERAAKQEAAREVAEQEAEAKAKSARERAERWEAARLRAAEEKAAKEVVAKEAREKALKDSEARRKDREAQLEEEFAFEKKALFPPYEPQTGGILKAEGIPTPPGIKKSVSWARHLDAECERAIAAVSASVPGSVTGLVADAHRMLTEAGKPSSAPNSVGSPASASGFVRGTGGAETEILYSPNAASAKAALMLDRAAVDMSSVIVGGSGAKCLNSGAELNPVLLGVSDRRSKFAEIDRTASGGLNGTSTGVARAPADEYKGKSWKGELEACDFPSRRLYDKAAVGGSLDLSK